METDNEPRTLDLGHVNWPFCLLELKSALGGMSKGQLLKVKVSDHKVLSTMEQVLQFSPDRVIAAGEQDPLYVLTIQKG